eukprot:m.479712 g.479712  ORF g.479712 m.479712 type:complete len:312 (-) comp21705_c0_seq1:1359-2294(-)
MACASFDSLPMLPSNYRRAVRPFFRSWSSCALIFGKKASVASSFSPGSTRTSVSVAARYDSAGTHAHPPSALVWAPRARLPPQTPSHRHGISCKARRGHGQGDIARHQTLTQAPSHPCATPYRHTARHAVLRRRQSETPGVSLARHGCCSAPQCTPWRRRRFAGRCPLPSTATRQPHERVSTWVGTGATRAAVRTCFRRPVAAEEILWFELHAQHGHEARVRLAEHGNPAELVLADVPRDVCAQGVWNILEQGGGIETALDRPQVLVIPHNARANRLWNEPVVEEAMHRKHFVLILDALVVGVGLSRCNVA